MLTNLSCRSGQLQFSGRANRWHETNDDLLEECRGGVPCTLNATQGVNTPRRSSGEAGAAATSRHSSRTTITRPDMRARTSSSPLHWNRCFFFIYLRHVLSFGRELWRQNFSDKDLVIFTKQFHSTWLSFINTRLLFPTYILQMNYQKRWNNQGFPIIN